LLTRSAISQGVIADTKTLPHRQLFELPIAPPNPGMSGPPRATPAHVYPGAAAKIVQGPPHRSLHCLPLHIERRDDVTHPHHTPLHRSK
jgi:hypothetical protein